MTHPTLVTFKMDLLLTNSTISSVDFIFYIERDGKVRDQQLSVRGGVAETTPNFSVAVSTYLAFFFFPAEILTLLPDYIKSEGNNSSYNTVNEQNCQADVSF